MRWLDSLKVLPPRSAPALCDGLTTRFAPLRPGKGTGRTAATPGALRRGDGQLGRSRRALWTTAALRASGRSYADLDSEREQPQKTC